MRDAWGQEPRTDNRRRHDIEQRDTSPHQRGRTLLILKNGKAKQSRSRKIHRVYDAIGESKKSGKDVARQRREEDLQEHRPSRPS